MIVARVCGNVTCTGNKDNTEHIKMCVVNELDIPLQKETGRPIIAIDTVGATQGDLVLCTEDNKDNKAKEAYAKSTNLIIIGIVDSINLIGKRIYQKRIV